MTIHADWQGDANTQIHEQEIPVKVCHDDGDEDCVRISRTSADQEVLWNDNPCYLGGGRAICQK